MSEMEQYQIKEVLDKFGQDTDNSISEIKGDFKDFKTEVRNEFKSIGEKISNVVKTLSDYTLSNDNRIGRLEGDNKVTKARISVYIAIGTTFVMMAIQLYMSFKKA